MKYSAVYSNKINLDDFAEVIIEYKHSQEEDLPLFLEYNQKKDIVISISDLDEFIRYKEWHIFNAIYEQYPYFTLRFYKVSKFEEIPELVIDLLENLNMPYFFGICATTFDQLHYLLDLGVSQVYLAEDICFDLTRASRLCGETLIRVFPNVAQGSIKSGPALKKFFIRPEDVKEYADVVDIFEFWGPTDRQNVLRRIYEKGKWLGDLQAIILDLDIELESQYLIPQFAHIRKDCGRRCMKGEKCSVCEHIKSISEKLKEKNLMLKY